MQGYEGCIIFVSHDRYFIDSIANKILYISNKKPYYHEGNYETFKEEEASLLEGNKEEKVKKEKKTTTKKEKVYTEDDLARIEKQIQEIKQEEWKEENYMDPKKMKELGDQLEALNQEYERIFKILYEE